MRSLTAVDHDPEGRATALLGMFAGDGDYDEVLGPGDEVRKPDGTLLAYVAPAPLPVDVQRAGLHAIGRMKGNARRRGAAAGLGSPMDYATRRNKDGSMSRQRALSPKSLIDTEGGAAEADADPAMRAVGISGTAGNLDTVVPGGIVCRQTAYSAREAERFVHVEPLLRHAADAMRDAAPDRHAAQVEAASHLGRLRLFGLPFTTLTVNRNFRTAYHRDAGDLTDGIGVMVGLRQGALSGGRLVLPRYRVALDPPPGHVVVADVHEVHGNTPIAYRTERAARWMLVAYVRERMLRHCATTG
jgi:hypothetical protein